MSSQKKVQCSRFEPQTWRKTLCKNCFKTRNEHTEEATEELRTPDAMSDGAMSPEVLCGDKIVLRRGLVTPPRECQVGDFVNLWRRGSDSSSGRRTPISEDLGVNVCGRNTPTIEVSEGKEREKPKGKEADFVGLAAKGTTSGRNTPIIEEQKGKVSEGKGCKEPKDREADVIIGLENKGTRTPVREEPKGQEAPTAGGNAGYRISKVVEASVSLGAEVAQLGPTPKDVGDQFPVDTKGHLVTKANEPTDSPALTSVTRPSSGDQAKPTLVPLRSASWSPAPFSEASKAATVAEPSGKKPARESNIDASGRNAAGSQIEEELSSPGRNEGASINNRDFRTPEIGRKSQAAHPSAVLGAHSPLPSSATGVQRQPSVQNRTSNECTPASLTLGPFDKEKAGEENTSGSIGTNTNTTTSTTTISSSSSSNTGQAADAHTKIAQADAALESGASSYGKSLRCRLSSPVNTEASGGGGGGGGGVGSSPEEMKNSYCTRHGSSSPAPAACTGPDFSTAPTKQDATSDSRFNAASASVGVAQIDLAKSGELRPQEISPQNDGAPIGLNASAEPLIDSHHSDSSPLSLSRAKEEASLSLGGVALATPTNELVSNSVGSTTSGYQYVDANDSRLTYSSIAEGGDGFDSRSPGNTFYYLTSSHEVTGNQPTSSSEPSYPDQPRRKVTSLFHHVPGDSGGYPDEAQQSPNLRWTGSETDSPAFSSQADDETKASSYSSQGVGQPYQQPGSGRRRRRSRVISLDDSNAAMSGFDYNRSDAMMEGTRMVMESLREKVAQLQDQCERLEREKVAIGDLLATKKSDYEMMKEHFNGTISNLELEVQRLKSEKSRLLDKLQLPESERASLAAEENEIAELKRRLEEYENRYTEVVGENEDLKQEVRDLQLEMEEMHDQFREEETMEFRELQKELENTAKNCRILQFKLRKAERRNEQLESDRIQYDEKLRHYESCFQSSDDKRRIRVLEEDLRLAKESAVRLHAELERAEERKLKHQEELDRAKNSVNEADNKRLCLQNELDSMKHEMIKLRDELRFDGRQEVIKIGGVYKISVPEADTTVAQLTKDLKDSLERENDLKEQLKFSEEENATMRKKLLEMEEETESMSLQLRKLSSAKSGRYMKVKAGDQGVDSEASATERESELRLQMELAEQEVKVLKRKMDELQQDNDNLLCAIKYLRSKLEQRDGARSATPIGDTKSTRDLLTRLGAAAAEEEAAAGDGIRQQLEGSQKEVLSLRDRVKELEREKSRLAADVQKLQATGVPAEQNGPTATLCVNGTAEEAIEKEKNLVKTIEELEQLLMEEKEKAQLVANENQTLESNLQQEKSLLTQELADIRKDLTRSGEELKKMKTELELAEKEKAALKKELSDSAQQKEELKAANDMKNKLESLQKTLSDLQSEHEKLLKEKSKPAVGPATGATKDKEPASWRWEKQDLEKQVKEFKKKFEDLQAEMKKSQAKSKDNSTKVTDDAKDVAKLMEECEGYKKHLEEMNKKLSEMEENLKKAGKEKEKASKELKEALEKAVAKEKAEAASKSKDLGTKFKDDTSSAEKKKLAKDLEMEKKRNEELVKERDLLVREKESWTSEKKKLVHEKDAAIKEKEELAAKTGNESEEAVKRSTPFGLRSKVGMGGKSAEAADSAKIKELTETLEKKEAELKTLKAKAETKGPGERLGTQAKELSDLKKEMERLEQDLDESAAERKTLKSDIQKLKDKLKTSEDVWNKERVRLEQDLKEANEKAKPLSKTLRGSDESLKQEKEALVKEKLKLIEDVTKLKKDLGELDKKRSLEKDGFEKTLKEKTKALDETKTTCEELQKEIEQLKALVTGSKPTSSAASKVVTIPVQSDRSAKAIPIQKISSRSFNSSASSEDQDLQSTACLAAIEETYRSRTRTLEDELGGLREQLTSVQRDSEAQSVKSQKAFAELKANFDKEFSAWNNERELLKRNGKLADEYGSKVTKLEKTLEELNGKLKVEEAKRRELEVKLLAQENYAAKGDKATTPTTEEKPKVAEEKTAAGQKSMEFRNRFEKFGGTPRPVRKLSLPSSTSTTPSSSDSGEKSDDWVGGIQRQMTETEKARLQDREELLEKMERQKKDFELRLEAFKETTKMLDAKSQELSTLEKKMAEVHCQLEEERSNWVKERSKLQSRVNDVQQTGREDKEKVSDLMREIKKLQLLTSEKGATSSLSGTSNPLTPSTPLCAEKPGFRLKTPEVSASQSPQPMSIVIPVRKVDSDKKTPSTAAEDETASPAATSNGVGKLSKKLFPFATDSQTSSSSSAKSYTSGQRTPIPINRISRSNPPKV